MDTTVFHNPACSKCRTLQGLLAERGVDANYFEYLEKAPSTAELQSVMKMLGIDDPRAMMRTKEAVYAELSLADADADALLEAMAANPVLIERPILVRGNRAVIARPPEKALELLD